MAATACRSWSAGAVASDTSQTPIRPRRFLSAGRSTDGGGVRSAMRVLLAVHVVRRPSRELRLVVAGPAWPGSGSAVVAGGAGGALDGLAGAVLDEARDRERGADDAQVGVGVLALAVAGGAGLRVMPDCAGAGIR